MSLHLQTVKTTFTVARPVLPRTEREAEAEMARMIFEAAWKRFKANPTSTRRVEQREAFSIYEQAYAALHNRPILPQVE